MWFNIGEVYIEEENLWWFNYHKLKKSFYKNDEKWYIHDRKIQYMPKKTHLKKYRVYYHYGNKNIDFEYFLI